MQEKEPNTIIFGVDPGTAVTGYGIILVSGSNYQALDYGCIRPPLPLKLSDRYLIIFESLEQLLEKYRPNALAVETQFVQHNVQSAMKIGMARGIAIVAAKKKGIPVFEYTPMRAKRAVVGNGKASKEQVQSMVQKLLRLAEKPRPQDASDALSLAICHAQASSSCFHGLKNEEI